MTATSPCRLIWNYSFASGVVISVVIGGFLGERGRSVSEQA